MAFLQTIKAHFPIKNLCVITLVWISLALLNFISIRYWNYWVGTDWFFPFSILKPSYFLLSGFLFSGLFGILGYIAFQKRTRVSIWGVIGWCIALIIVGNLMQGNFDNAFLKPFYLGGQQYYSDAIHVQDAGIFLREFHERQETYLLHTKTHPPFVVLLHYYFLQISGGSIAFLSISIFLLSVLIFPVMNTVFRNFGFEEAKRKNMLLFLSIIPSVNIYSLVSIDGLVLVAVALSLLAVSSVYRFGLNIWAMVWGILSMIFSNMLSFSGLFTVAFMGLFALVRLYRKDYSYAILVAISLSVCTLFFIGCYIFLGYNHWEVFRTASASENPDGFLLFANPRFYVGTRIQDIAEIMMFLSMPFISLWFSKKYRQYFLTHRFPVEVAFSAIFVLLLMFSTGAYGTGETARACLFIVPFIFILNRDFPQKTFTVVYFLCLLQTLAMQTVGNFFW